MDSLLSLCYGVCIFMPFSHEFVRPFQATTAGIGRVVAGAWMTHSRL